MIIAVPPLEKKGKVSPDNGIILVIDPVFMTNCAKNKSAIPYIIFLLKVLLVLFAINIEVKIITKNNIATKTVPTNQNSSPTTAYIESPAGSGR